MFLSIDEMKAVLYSYQMDEIAEGDDTIITMGIEAAVQEVRAYYAGSNQKKWDDGRPKYDIDAIFSATGTDRDAWVLRMCQTVAAWNICQLANPDIIYDHVKERYNNVIRALESIAKGEITPDLPTITEDPDDPTSVKKPFRYGSRPKFNHE